MDSMKSVYKSCIFPLFPVSLSSRFLFCEMFKWILGVLSQTELPPRLSQNLRIQCKFFYPQLIFLGRRTPKERRTVELVAGETISSSSRGGCVCIVVGLCRRVFKAAELLPFQSSLPSTTTRFAGIGQLLARSSRAFVLFLPPKYLTLFYTATTATTANYYYGESVWLTREKVDIYIACLYLQTRSF